MAAETIVAAILIVALMTLIRYAFSDGSDRRDVPQLLSISSVIDNTELRVVVEGSGFGDMQGFWSVYVGGERADIEAWSDTSITCTCKLTPSRWDNSYWDNSYKVVVRTESGFSNHMQFTAEKTAPAISAD